ncbi:hypothetical protein TWF718_002558 [Orbilia javanica]|uniref:Uncharacterized protein n=1 Tax=Orbilia javanica TaxID=47235 RepID=A0AAN8MKA3_9PEZI
MSHHPTIPSPSPLCEHKFKMFVNPPLSRTRAAGMSARPERPPVRAAALGLTSKQQRNDVGECREATCSHNLTGLLTPWRHSALITLALAKYQVIGQSGYQIVGQLTPQAQEATRARRIGHMDLA